MPRFFGTPRLLPWVLVLAVVLLVVPGISHAAGCSNTSLGGGVTCKASASGSNTSGSNLASLSTASTLNVTTGDTLVAAIRYESGCFTTYPQSLFITDTAGNYFQLATSTTGGGGSWCIASYYAPGVIGNASDTVTVYFNTAQAYPAIIVHDLSGLAVTSATSTLDQVALGTAASASSVSTAPFTTTQSTEYLFAAGAVNNTGVSFTAGPGYTDVTTDSGGMISTEQDLVTTIQSAATSSMSAGGTNPWGITAMTLVAGSAPTGSGIPTGHGVVVWGATGYTSSQCGAPSCIMKVTDSAGNTYTTKQTIDDPGANIDEFLAVGPVTSAIAGDGSGWVKCSFYDNNGTTPIPGGAIYCRVFDDSNMASTGSVDSSNNNGGENAGALTVTGGNTDLAFAVYDLEATGLTATPGSGYTSIIPALLDGEGGMQYAEYEEVTAGTTPTASYSPSNPAGWGLDAALKETTSGGTISYVGGVLAPTNQTSTIIQVPGYYGSSSSPTVIPPAPTINSSSTDFFLRSGPGSIFGNSMSTDFSLFNSGEVLALPLMTSADFQIFSGIIKPIFQPVKPNYTLIHYQWRDDNGTEANASSATGGVEDTALTGLAQSSSIRLRMEITNDGGTFLAYSPQSFQLQYGLLSTTCSAISSWTAVGVSGSTWSMYNSSNLTDGSSTTNIATSTGGVVAANHTFITPNYGVKTTTSTVAAISVPSDSFIDMEFDVEALASSTAGGTYCFRLTNIGSNTNFTYTEYPEATLSSSSSTESITLTLNSSTVTLPGLSPGTAVSATTTATVHVTGATSGFTLSINRNSATSTIASGTITFPDYTSWAPSGSSCASGQGNGTTTPGNNFSFRVASSGTSANYCSFWWGNSDSAGTAIYAGVPTSSQIIVNSTSSASQNGTSTVTIIYSANAPSSQKATKYTGSVTITAIANP